MKLEWDGKIGPAAIVGSLGIAIQVIAVIWVGSSIYTKIIDRIDVQGSKIEEVAQGSDKRFETVRTALAQTHANQTQTAVQVSRVETAISYISSQVQRVESKLDGATPPAPAIPPPKP